MLEISECSGVQNFIYLTSACLQQRRHSRWKIPRTSPWPRSLTRTSMLVNLTALARHETTVSRILADDGEPGSAKFRSRRDAHKKARHDTIILAPGTFERVSVEQQPGCRSLVARRIFVSLWLKCERRGKTPRKLQSQRARDLSFSPLSFEE